MNLDNSLRELAGYYFSKVIPSNQEFPTEDALEFCDKIKSLLADWCIEQLPAEKQPQMAGGGLDVNASWNRCRQEILTKFNELK